MEILHGVDREEIYFGGSKPIVIRNSYSVYLAWISNVGFTLQNQFRMIMVGHTGLLRDFYRIKHAVGSIQIAAELIFSWKIVHTQIIVETEAQFQEKHDMVFIIIFTYSLCIIFLTLYNSLSVMKYDNIQSQYDLLHSRNLRNCLKDVWTLWFMFMFMSFLR